MRVQQDPALHCFREDSPTEQCRDCGHLPGEHTGCDCEDVRECYSCYSPNATRIGGVQGVPYLWCAECFADEYGDVPDFEPDLPLPPEERQS